MPKQTVSAVPALIIVAVFTSVAGYMWGVYTQTNPSYDEPVRNFFQNNIVDKGSEVSHGSANMDTAEDSYKDGKRTFINEYKETDSVSNSSFLVKSHYEEGMVTLVVSSIRNLPEDTQFQVIIDGEVVDVFSNNTHEFSFTPTKKRTPILVTALNNEGEWIEGDDGELLTARADIIE